MGVNVFPKRNLVQVLRSLGMALVVFLLLYPLTRKSVDYRAPIAGADNIFFVEPTCVSPAVLENDLNSVPEGGLRLSQGQACAVEALASFNPERTVYVVHTCPLREDLKELWPKHALAALALPNVRLWPVSFEEVMRGVPRYLAEELYENGLEHSSTPREDGLRLAQLTLLWRYGGVSVDPFCVINKPLGNLRDFAMMESGSVSLLVWGLSWSSVGQHLATTLMSRMQFFISSEYSIWSWSLFATQTVKGFCPQMTATKSIPKDCFGLRVLQKEELLVMSKSKWIQYFSGDSTYEGRKITNETLGICIRRDKWENPILSNLHQIQGEFARRLCPNIAKRMR